MHDAHDPGTWRALPRVELRTPQRDGNAEGRCDAVTVEAVRRLALAVEWKKLALIRHGLRKYASTGVREPLVLRSCRRPTMGGCAEAGSFFVKAI